MVVVVRNFLIRSGMLMRQVFAKFPKQLFEILLIFCLKLSDFEFSHTVRKSYL